MAVMYILNLSLYVTVCLRIYLPATNKRPSTNVIVQLRIERVKREPT